MVDGNNNNNNGQPEIHKNNVDKQHYAIFFMSVERVVTLPRRIQNNIRYQHPPPGRPASKVKWLSNSENLKVDKNKHFIIYYLVAVKTYKLNPLENVSKQKLIIKRIKKKLKFQI